MPDTVPPVPTSTSVESLSKLPALLTMFIKWMAVQAKGIRYLPSLWQNCSAWHFSFSNFSLFCEENSQPKKLKGEESEQRFTKCYANRLLLHKAAISTRHRTVDTQSSCFHALKPPKEPVKLQRAPLPFQEKLMKTETAFLNVILCSRCSDHLELHGKLKTFPKRSFCWEKKRTKRGFFHNSAYYRAISCFRKVVTYRPLRSPQTGDIYNKESPVAQTLLVQNLLMHLAGKEILKNHLFIYIPKHPANPIPKHVSTYWSQEMEFFTYIYIYTPEVKNTPFSYCGAVI